MCIQRASITWGEWISPKWASKVAVELSASLGIRPNDQSITSIITNLAPDPRVRSTLIPRLFAPSTQLYMAYPRHAHSSQSDCRCLVAFDKQRPEFLQIISHALDNASSLKQYIPFDIALVAVVRVWDLNSTLRQDGSTCLLNPSVAVANVALRKPMANAAGVARSNSRSGPKAFYHPS